MSSTKINIDRYYQSALWLGFFTIFYNLLEGLVSIFFGVQDETLTLFGFGVDSFIEILSGLGIVIMVLRIRRNPDAPHTPFERSALRVTGISFFLLCAGLFLSAVYNMISGHKPESTLPGVIISIVSISLMWMLVAGKRKVGHALNSDPILADANCSLVCIYMSLVLLVSSLIYRLTGFGFVDSIGAFGLIFFSFREGRESLERARDTEYADN